MSLYRKAHYDALASILKKVGTEVGTASLEDRRAIHATLWAVANQMSLLFGRDSERFSRDKFMIAMNPTSEEVAK